MPGILPMKVIKIGSNAQTRIAQACDRCRSKKIRCDGIRPCCTQCANVGFECKTSDKLSRRAFPRGYTESLEERVRTLEAEVRELKDLLDEKDEKIDMLSRIHSHSSQPIQLPSPRRGSESSQEAVADDFHNYDEPDEVFKIKQAPCLQGQGNDSYLAGPSSTRAYIESFKQKAKDNGFSLKNVQLNNIFLTHERRSSTASEALSTVWSAPPRLVSDQLVNVFFQEWAPLFPVLHRPAFLTTYENYVANPEAMHDKAELAQLNLVFAIASASTGTATEELDSIESQWRAALDTITSENTIETLQALALAQIHCLQKGDTTSLLTYKGLSLTISSRLGLHQAQKSFTFDSLTIETRKKLFWTLYTLDCFSAVVLGLSKQIKDDEVFCEYPVDADDEYITETGFLPTLPGESTRLSAALALFKATRILSRVLEEVFPARASYELSLKTLSDLSDELELWEAALPTHLRLHFAQDKPSTGTITSRSPVLSLAYHYIRALIQRPAICSKSLGKKASSALMVHAASCKRIVQIFQLLNERSLTFSFCLNKDEVLVSTGIGLLIQRMELDASSKISKDNQKTIVTIVELLNHSESQAISETFRQLVTAFIPTLELPAANTTTMSSPGLKRSSKPSISRSSSDKDIVSDQPNSLHTSARKQLKAIASRFGSHAVRSQRLSMSSIDGLEVQSSASSRAPLSMSPVISNNGLSTSPLSDTSLHLSLSHSPPDSAISKLSGEIKRPYSLPKSGKRPKMPPTNLDYLSFGNEPEQEVSAGAQDFSRPIKSEPQPTDWERLLGNLDNGTTNIFDACYGGPAIEALADPLDLDYNRRASTAIKDAALAWNTGLLSLQEQIQAISTDHSPSGTTVSSSDSNFYHSENNTATNSAADLSLTNWTSTTSSNQGNDALSALVFADVGGLDYDFDLGIDWQDALISSSV